ncbi:ABC transporter substrate-binding protein [Microbacterium indicum]|uniref:ABC transporter substrate-binding protein n=1 Tax=Microbacterium indicum TaxID=358100 RepID=UPI0004227DC6|nr:ABC transporter substrate-binding protein [Microbacterium indicum]
MRPFARTTAAALAVGLVIALAACSPGAETAETAATSEPVDGGTLTWAIGAQPTAGGVDPMIATALAAQTIMDQGYETLLTKNDDGEIEPGLALSYDQPDDTTFVFTLRDDVKFADGSDFTADDVVYTFETYQQATTSKKAYLANLESVEATGDDEVTFHFSSPDGTFLNAVSHRETFMIVGREGYGAASEDERSVQTYGTGPFQVTDWEDGVSLTLTRNEYYTGDAGPYVDEIVLSVIPDESTRLSALQQGTVQAAYLGDGTLADQAVQGGLTLGNPSYTQSLPIFINPESGPLSDVRVRQAVSLALDRQALIDTAMFGYGEVSTAIPAGDPAAPEVTDETPYYTRDVEAAKELLSEAGQPDPTITLSYFSDALASQHPIYELMQQQLAEAGITLELKATPTAELAPIFTAGETFTDLVSLPWSYRADPTFYFDPFLSEAGAMNHWSGNADAERATELLAEAKAAIDEDEKAELTAELNDEVAEQVLVLVPMSVPSNFEVWDANALQGYDSDPYGSRYRLTESWLAE